VATSERGYKTLAIRLDDGTHAQLQVIAKLEETTIADEIRQAIEAHLDAKRSDEQLSSKAAEVLADINREAEARQAAIANLFDTSTSATRSTRSKRTTTKDETES
jgi:predicted DNA-binding protein